MMKVHVANSCPLAVVTMNFIISSRLFCKIKRFRREAMLLLTM